MANIDTLTLLGNEVAVVNRNIPQSELKFFTDNPRIYSIIHSGDHEPSQVFIEKKMGQMDHVKQLVQSIEANGGLIDPLIVRDGDFVVLEGNSRLAAYRLLARKNAIKWGNVKCTLLPYDIGEELIFALLGEYHIIGRKDWAPYEQAGYLYRRFKKYKTSPSKMAKEMGLSVKKINHLINVYSFMVEHKDENVQRWSYYDEYLKSYKIKKARDEYLELDDTFANKVKKGEIPKAVDVRKKVTLIAGVGGKILKTFVEKEDCLETCYNRAIEGGGNNNLLNLLNRFKKTILDPDTKKELLKMPENQLKKCKFELNKINMATKRLLDKIDI